MQQHNHQKPKPFFCCYLCDYKTDHKATFERHNLKHKFGRFQCLQCQMPFLREENLVLHNQLKHSDEINKTIPDRSICHQCSYCVYKTCFKPQMDRHILKHNLAQHSCKICEMPFLNKANIFSHIKLKHPLELNNFAENMILNEELDSVTTPCFSCPHCLNTFDSQTFLQTYQTDRVCPVCNMSFPPHLVTQQKMIVELNIAAQKSFDDLNETPKRQCFSNLQGMGEFYRHPESDSPNGKNQSNHQVDSSNSFDLIEINDDDDDDDDVDDSDWKPNDNDTSSNIHQIDDTSFYKKKNQPELISDSLHHNNNNNNNYDPLNESDQPSSTSLNQSNSKRGRFVKLVSDFDDFAERPYACALCYQRYSQFNQLRVHVENHLTGAGALHNNQTTITPSYPW